MHVISVLRWISLKICLFYSEGIWSEQLFWKQINCEHSLKIVSKNLWLLDILCSAVNPEPIAMIRSRKTLRKRTSSCPVQHIEQSKCIQLTIIDTSLQLTLCFTFLRRTIENCNYIIITVKKVSFALLSGWNVTKTSFDHMSGYGRILSVPLTF